MNIEKLLVYICTCEIVKQQLDVVVKWYMYYAFNADCFFGSYEEIMATRRLVNISWIQIPIVLYKTKYCMF